MRSSFVLIETLQMATNCHRLYNEFFHNYATSILKKNVSIDFQYSYQLGIPAVFKKNVNPSFRVDQHNIGFIYPNILFLWPMLSFWWLFFHSGTIRFCNKTDRFRFISKSKFKNLKTRPNIRYPENNKTKFTHILTKMYIIISR